MAHHDRDLGLAVPLVVAVSTALSARNGLLIRDRTAFGRARELSAVVFDKTGTLTEGRFGVTDILPLAALELARATYRKMIQNLWWATGYNVVALPLAAGVLYRAAGILLSPAFGAVLMSASTVLVALNAQRFSVLSPPPDQGAEQKPDP